MIVARKFLIKMRLLSIVCQNQLEEVTNENYQLLIGDSEELVARFLKAFDDKTIDRMLIVNPDETKQPVKFDRLPDDHQCRLQIHRMLDRYASGIPRNKIFELSFTKFLYRRVLFFLGGFYSLNQTVKHLGTTVMKQMIEEAKTLSQIDFSNDNFRKVYLVYDPGFSLQILHTNWSVVPIELKQLFRHRDPLEGSEFCNKNPFAKCLSWLINIPYDQFERLMNESKFVLTENFAYKLFHIHERKLTKMPLIIEGDTGKVF
ncbi:unnamed protein product [Didymodactylos carnosus]|uniref:Uncharacterized protein n=1 Tax=Didymodactylos carnosus TaxID=1234261 RepID=A0A815K761_9BILA|nr:unnamed protein product [Didymodactylos carnosus]CAF4284176.1 unnamed protein product [Didymodactylos carnosus]